jgi:nitrogen regulatory protein PII
VPWMKLVTAIIKPFKLDEVVRIRTGERDASAI